MSSKQNLIFNRSTDNYWFTAQDIIAPSDSKNLRLRSRDTTASINITDNSYVESIGVLKGSDTTELPADISLGPGINGTFGPTTWNSNIIMSSDNIIISGPSNETYNPNNVTTEGVGAGFKEFVFNSTRAIQLPRGTSDQRPDYGNKKGREGQIRYNLDYNQFEGHNGFDWNIIGGLRDADGDTFITAENRNETDTDQHQEGVGGQGARNNQLSFFTGDSTAPTPREKMRILGHNPHDVSGHDVSGTPARDDGEVRFGYDLSTNPHDYTIELNTRLGLITASGGIIIGDRSTRDDISGVKGGRIYPGNDYELIIDPYQFDGMNRGVSGEDQPLREGDASGVVIIRGDLKVQGNTTTINSTVIEISDVSIRLGGNLDSENNLEIAADKKGLLLGPSSEDVYAGWTKKFVYHDSTLGNETTRKNNDISQNNSDKNDRWFSNISMHINESLTVGTGDDFNGNTTSNGRYALKTGSRTSAIGFHSTAMGKSTQAMSHQSVAWGESTEAKDSKNTTAFGESSDATGVNATAFGLSTVASFNQSVAWGESTEAKTAKNTTAFGYNTDATGVNATAFGNSTLASFNQSVAWGNSTYATTAANTTAFGNNTWATGLNATAFGKDTSATNLQSVAWGESTTASTQANSTAWGLNGSATGSQATKFGNSSVASGTNSTAFGESTDASGVNATAFGLSATASSSQSVAWGQSTTASTQANATAWGLSGSATGAQATKFGQLSSASGTNSTAFGLSTIASFNQSVAWGEETYAKDASNTTAFGYRTYATGENSTAFGKDTSATNLQSVAWGELTEAMGSKNTTAFGESTDASGVNATAWGLNGSATGSQATKFGESSFASGTNSTAFGLSTTANNSQATTFGQNSVASGVNSTAFGQSTLASGLNATAFGKDNSANGFNNTVFGWKNEISGNTNTAWGYNNIIQTYSDYSTVFGSNNVLEHGINTTVMGANSNVSDAINSLIDGSGNTIASATNTIIFGLSNEITNTYNSITGGNNNVVTTISNGLIVGYSNFNTGGENYLIAGENNTAITASKNGIIAGKNNRCTNENSSALGEDNSSNHVNSFAFGKKTTAAWEQSVAWGEETIASTSKNTTSFGYGSHASGMNATAFGKDTSATNLQSVAWGESTIASTNKNTTAFGNSTTAIGENATAWGFNTRANATDSTALGHDSSANATGSTAIGKDVIADGSYSLVVGSRNIRDANKIFMVGTGQQGGSIHEARTALSVNYDANTHIDGNINLNKSITTSRDFVKLPVSSSTFIIKKGAQLKTCKISKPPQGDLSNQWIPLVGWDASDNRVNQTDSLSSWVSKYSYTLPSNVNLSRLIYHGSAKTTDICHNVASDQESGFTVPDYRVEIIPSSKRSLIHLNYKINYSCSHEANQTISFKVTRRLFTRSRKSGTAYIRSHGLYSDDNYSAWTEITSHYVGDEPPTVFQDLDLGTAMGVSPQTVYYGAYIDDPADFSNVSDWNNNNDHDISDIYIDQFGQQTRKVEYTLHFKVKDDYNNDIDIPSGIVGYDENSGTASYNMITLQEIYQPHFVRNISDRSSNGLTNTTTNNQLSTNSGSWVTHYNEA